MSDGVYIHCCICGKDEPYVEGMERQYERDIIFSYRACKDCQENIIRYLRMAIGKGW
jgi:hypothetical protein